MALIMGGCSSRRPNAGVSNQPITAISTNSGTPILINIPPVVSNLDTINLPTQGVTNSMQLSTNFPPSHLTPTIVSNASVSATLADTVKAYDAGLISKGQAMQVMILDENKKALDLYGMVVDQNGEPVVGAKVQGNVMLNVNFVRSKDEIYFTETDSDGMFSFLGLHGIGLGVWPQKQGYDYNLKLPSKRPENYRPDPNNPVVFTMWKIRGAEPMIHTELDSRVPYDGTSATFNLATGKKIVSGDLRITLLRSPLLIQRGHDKFDWKATIEMLGGSLLPKNDLYPNWAPDAGYQPFFKVSVTATNIPWSQELKQNFYFRNAQGQYGRLFIGLATDSMRPDTGINIQAWINPSGSQNLEFDRKKQIR